MSKITSKCDIPPLRRARPKIFSGFKAAKRCFCTRICECGRQAALDICYISLSVFAISRHISGPDMPKKSGHTRDSSRASKTFPARKPSPLRPFGMKPSPRAKTFPARRVRAQKPSPRGASGLKNLPRGVRQGSKPSPRGASGLRNLPLSGASGLKKPSPGGSQNLPQITQTGIIRFSG